MNIIKTFYTRHGDSFYKYKQVGRVAGIKEIIDTPEKYIDEFANNLYLTIDYFYFEGNWELVCKKFEDCRGSVRAEGFGADRLTIRSRLREQKFKATMDNIINEDS